MKNVSDRDRAKDYSKMPDIQYRETEYLEELKNVNRDIDHIFSKNTKSNFYSLSNSRR